jgi:hypothetical protein
MNTKIAIGHRLWTVVVLIAVAASGSFAPSAYSQTAPIGNFTVVTVTSPSSAGAAGTLADQQIQQLVTQGWEPIGIAADYKSDSREGTTVANSRVWAVYVLLKCSATGPGSCKK